MKIRNLTIKYTDCKTINSNNSVKFEVNWPRGSLVRARHLKRTDRRTDSRTLVYHNTSRLKVGRMKTVQQQNLIIALAKYVIRN
jgi:hypothetical protein